MPVRVDEDGFEACSRVAGVAVADYTLRAMERWRANVADLDSAMIMLAVIAISSARLLRADDLPADQLTLEYPADRSLLTKVNVAGIAHATGLNRETARRKVNELIAAGELAKAEDGSISFAPGLVHSERVREQVRGQIAEVCAVVEQLERMGVLVRDGQT